MPEKYFLKVDCINTHYGLTLTNDDVKTKKFDELDGFLNYIADNFRIEFYFKVENGNFKWL